VEGTVVKEEVLSSDSETQLLVRFQNGEQVVVPRTLLNRQTDGRYRLEASIEELLADQQRLQQTTASHHTSYQASTTSSSDTQEEAEAERPLVIPVTEERVRVQTRTVETGRVEIHKTVHEHTDIVDHPLQAEEVEIERVAINRLIEEPVAVRYEGDTTIVPLLEEVLVVEKRLVLREEVHIRKVHKEVHAPQEVQLREERVEIVRKPGSNRGTSQEVD
jgi:uncharacterized protein (TIGR02271 family)